MTTWYAYQLIEHHPPEELSQADMFSGMQVFEKEYKVEFQPVPHFSLLTWELELEEKTRRRSSRRSLAEALPPVKRRFSFAFSTKDEIIFSNKMLSKKNQTYMAKALHCQRLELIPDLANGTPTNLLMLHNQAKNPGLLELQYQEKLFEAMEELSTGKPLTTDFSDSDEHKKLHLQLGSIPEQIPQIKKVKVDVRQVPINTEDPELQDYRLEEVGVEVSGPSVFHFYKSLVENGIIEDIPPWLKKLRQTGKTRCSAYFK